MSASPSAQTPLTSAQTRIPISSKPHKATAPGELTVQQALDFWSLAGSTANVAMQFGWPGVAYGVMESPVESGSLVIHPWKRARTTLQYLAVAILGTKEEKEAYRDAVNSAHRLVHSTKDSPVKYSAMSRELQMWVAACLYIGLEDTYQLLHGRLSPEQANEFYQTSFTLGTTLQVQENQWPATRAEFETYWNQECEKVVIDAKTRGYLNDMIDFKMINPVPRFFLAPLGRFFTAGFLPPLFRSQLGITWTDTDRRRFDNYFSFIAFINKFLPRRVRFMVMNGLLWDLRRRIRKNKPLI